MSRWLVHNIGNVAFRVSNPPEDNIWGYPLSELPDGDKRYIMRTPCTRYEIIPIDESGVVHYEHSTGRILETAPLYRYRFVLDWKALRVGTMSAGILETVGEYEWLLWLDRHRAWWSGNGRGRLYVRLNHLIDEDWDSPAQEREWRVVLVGMREYRTPERYIWFHGAEIVLETIDRQAYREVSFVRDRRPEPSI